MKWIFCKRNFWTKEFCNMTLSGSSTSLCMAPLNETLTSIHGVALSIHHSPLHLLFRDVCGHLHPTIVCLPYQNFWSSKKKTEEDGVYMGPTMGWLPTTNFLICKQKRKKMECVWTSPPHNGMSALPKIFWFSTKWDELDTVCKGAALFWLLYFTLFQDCCGTMSQALVKKHEYNYPHAVSCSCMHVSCMLTNNNCRTVCGQMEGGDSSKNWWICYTFNLWCNG